VRLVPVALLLSLALAAPVLAQVAPPPALNAEAALLVDADGKVLFAKNAGEEHAPASLVKMMTLYLAFEDLRAGRVQLEDLVTISANAASTPRYRLRLRAGEVIPLRVLLDGVGVASANDAALAVAEYLGGSEEAFVQRMNTTAEALGLQHTHFANPHGLPDPRQRTTASDIAMLTGRLVEDYPESRDLLSSQSFIFRGRVHSRAISLFQNPGGVQALKTGFTREAGYNVAVSAWRNGQSYLLVVMGAQTRSLSFRDAGRLLRFAFGEIGPERIDEAPKRAKAQPRRSRSHQAKAPVRR